ncbi:hypothetical protein ABZ776_25970 [Streptomyces sp. NPDC007076]|nr:hypothetical protein [Streptomyces sp. JV190]MEE1842832.1 hypothetical protein [Streptomyces sp. JV190]
MTTARTPVRTGAAQRLAVRPKARGDGGVTGAEAANWYRQPEGR